MFYIRSWPRLYLLADFRKSFVFDLIESILTVIKLTLNVHNALSKIIQFNANKATRYKNRKHTEGIIALRHLLPNKCKETIWNSLLKGRHQNDERNKGKDETDREGDENGSIIFHSDEMVHTSRWVIYNLNLGPVGGEIRRKFHLFPSTPSSQLTEYNNQRIASVCMQNHKIIFFGAWNVADLICWKLKSPKCQRSRKSQNWIINRICLCNNLFFVYRIQSKCFNG